MKNTIDVTGHQLEGIQFRGCDNFLISENKVSGRIDGPKEGRSNDMIQVGPTQKDGNPGAKYPFVWGEKTRKFVQFRRPDVADGWTVYSRVAAGGPFAERTCYWAFETGRYIRGGVIEKNEVANGGIAGVFVWNAIGTKIVNNVGRNFKDYTLGVEWGINCEISGNTAIQEPRYRWGSATNGGVSVMHLADRNVVRDNALEGCNVWVVPWGVIQDGVQVWDNRISDGGIMMSYLGTPISHNLSIRNNSITRGFVQIHSSPFYTTGEIIGNRLSGGVKENRYGMTLESFKERLQKTESRGA